MATAHGSRFGRRRSLGKQPYQLAGLVEPDKVDSTADVSLANEDLRESVSAETVAKLDAHAVDVLSGSDLVDRGAATAQAPPGPKAVTAHRLRVEGHLGHEMAVIALRERSAKDALRQAGGERFAASAAPAAIAFARRGESRAEARPTPRTKRRRQCRLASLRPEPRRKGSGAAARPSVRRPAGAIEPERAAAPATGGEPRRRSGLPAVCRSPRSVRCASPEDTCGQRPRRMLQTVTQHGRSRGATSLLLRARCVRRAAQLDAQRQGVRRRHVRLW